MTSQSETHDNDNASLYDLKGKDLENFGFARVRDIAYDAVQDLWQRRKAEGWTQVQVAENLNRDTGWLSKHLKGSGNWTFRTFGTLVQGLNGTVEIVVHAAEDTNPNCNYNPYSNYVMDVHPIVLSGTVAKIDIFGTSQRAPLKISPTNASIKEPA